MAKNLKIKKPCQEELKSGLKLGKLWIITETKKKH